MADKAELTAAALADHNEAEEEDNSWRPKFIPRGYEKLNPDIYRAIFYSTSTADGYRAPISHCKSTPVLLEQARGTNVQAIHDPNRAAQATPGGFKPNVAPLYQRSMCAYTSQFVPRPLDGKMINAECYKLFKEKCTSSSVSSSGTAKFRGISTTLESYPQYGEVESQKAIPPNFKPIQEKHVSAENKILVTKSASHREFPCPSVEHTKTARPEAFKPKYKTHRAVGSMSAVSSYKRDFHSDRYNSVWPVKFARQAQPPGPTTGYTGVLSLDEKAEKKLEPKDFCIGDVITLGPC